MSVDAKVREELLVKYTGKASTTMRIKRRYKVIAWELTVALSHAVKRAVDIMGSLVMIILLLPVFGITAVAILLEDGGSVFYVQTRVGKNGRLFGMYKFRSMVRDAEKLKDSLMSENDSGDGVIFKMKNDPRMTRTGKFIRKFSIDELPQFFNVLKGDMSLVGPRPPVPREVELYEPDDRKRLHVVPGITCIWQVSGRSDIPFKQQVGLDMEYIKSRSLLADIKLLLRTIPAVLFGKGGY